MTRHPETDVVIVGLGWAGSILAAELTKAGLSVVGLERGPARTTSDEVYTRAHDELRYSLRGELVQDTSRETWTLRHDLRETALPVRYPGSFRPGEGTGGSGVAWGGACLRFAPDDFRLRSVTVERYGEAAIPADCTIQDWPIGFDELEPYYDRFERMAGTTGIAGNLRGELRPGGNPFEGPRSREYPLPPLQDAESTSLLRSAAQELGLHPFPHPVANLSQTYTNPDGITRGACTYCGMCARHACQVGAKADPNVTVIPVAQRSDRFELRPHARVFRVDHKDGRASGVRYHDAKGDVHEQPAAIVILAAYALNNVRLLLLLDLGERYDPVTSSGVVGRNYSYQVMGGGTAFFEDRMFKRYMGATGASVLVDDFNAHSFDHSGLDFIGGGNLILGARGAAPITGVSLPAGTPTWGAEWKAALRQWYDRSVSVNAVGEVLAYRDNHLDLDPTYRDAWGDPLLRITFDWKENERRLIRYLGEQAATIFAAVEPASSSVVRELPEHYDITRYQSTHNTGGAVMGDDPKTSAVNRYLQSWDAENVFVVGASAFPQNPGYGPTGTVGALAYWAADAIVDRYAKREGSLV